MSAGHNHCCMNPYNVYLRTEPPASNVAVVSGSANVLHVPALTALCTFAVGLTIDPLMQARLRCESEGEATCEVVAREPRLLLFLLPPAGCWLATSG